MPELTGFIRKNGIFGLFFSEISLFFPEKKGLFPVWRALIPPNRTDESAARFYETESFSRRLRRDDI